MTRALLGMLVVCLVLVAWSGAVSAMTPVGTLISSSCTLTASDGTVQLSPPCTFVVANWITVAGDTVTTLNSGETLWLTFTVTNDAGRPDTVALDTASLLG